MVIKQTFVTIIFRQKRYTYLIDCPMIDGHAFLPGSIYNALLDKIGVKHGETVSIG